MKSIWHLPLIAAVSSFFQPGFAQKLVDPNTATSEFRAAAKNRRAGQLKLHG
jgi:hypothetical protein